MDDFSDRQSRRVVDGEDRYRAGEHWVPRPRRFSRMAKLAPVVSKSCVVGAGLLLVPAFTSCGYQSGRETWAWIAGMLLLFLGGYAFTLLAEHRVAARPELSGSYPIEQSRSVLNTTAKAVGGLATGTLILVGALVVLFIVLALCCDLSWCC